MDDNPIDQGPFQMTHCPARTCLKHEPCCHAPEAYGAGITEHALSPVAVVDAFVPVPKPPSKIRLNREQASLDFWANLQAAALRRYGR